MGAPHGSTGCAAETAAAADRCGGGRRSWRGSCGSGLCWWPRCSSASPLPESDTETDTDASSSAGRRWKVGLVKAAATTTTVVAA
ncbi:Os09g0464350 [Oryza sativa Japonica Group]|uniref:Os09g0464350 protein n=1 Tax=Oryza sativa subsp. japonica TaxID=39947 RepID=A0A0P0XP88_ORYSJ|nr:hypothetical protein EE612_048369 [Oryza sativa]BAT08509.1 Os09g0464350 [Oryza sativa Japonica Group]